MLMERVSLCSVLFCVVSFAQVLEAQCKKPKDNEVPHGANEFILLADQVVERIQGRVFFPNSEPMEDIVLEVYRYNGGNSYQEISQVVQGQKRVAACLTGADGKFSFTRLRAGNYLLRAGTRHTKGFNEVYAILTLKPGRKTSAGKGLEIVLWPGT